jgi:hypothetical protein
VGVRILAAVGTQVACSPVEARTQEARTRAAWVGQEARTRAAWVGQEARTRAAWVGQEARTRAAWVDPEVRTAEGQEVRHFDGSFFPHSGCQGQHELI